MANIESYIKKQGVSETLLGDVEKFRKKYPLSEELRARIPEIPICFYGREIWEMAICALLEGENILLTGQKATGKNVLADNLSVLFGRPQWTTSFHAHTDSSSLIGTDTFIDNEVQLRRGAVYECAVNGGFGVFDEINMAKNDALAVLHSALDYRRIIDVPGYAKIPIGKSTRFIGTMNHNYAGTQELNEALLSRFMVLDIPQIDEETITAILKDEFPDAKIRILEQFAGVFADLQKKAENSEISSDTVDLRGIFGSLRTIHRGLPASLALKMGVSNKAFDAYERSVVQDVIDTRIVESWTGGDVFD